MIFKNRAAKYGMAAAICLIGLIVAYWAWKYYLETATPALSFDGNSDQLQQTVVVPALDSPLPEGKSAIWCASFQMAWNQLRSVAGGEPLQINGAEDICDSLNKSKVSKDDLNPEVYYAAAGLARDGVIEKIKKEMAERFPGVTTLPMRQDGLIAIAYSYLQAEVKFRFPFLPNRKPFLFESGDANPTPVSSFGIHEYI